MVATPKRPPALLEAYKANFHTLRRAYDNGTITPLPFAVMVEGNPFELFEDPTIL